MSKEKVDIPHPYPEPSPKPNPEDVVDAEIWRKCLMGAGFVMMVVLVIFATIGKQ